MSSRTTKRHFGGSLTSKLLPADIKWISVENVVQIHDVALDAFGGLVGFPNPGYLDSAVAAPLNSLHYDGGGMDLFDLAAAFLYHIAKAHAFTDGNKRSAYLAALIFLHVNGVPVPSPDVPTQLAEAVVEAAAGDSLEKDALAALLRKLYGAKKKRLKRRR